MLIKKHLIGFLLFCIVLFAGFLRFYRVNEVPVSLYWDSVATGYNAYSILKTGRDEYGTFIPILFRSFDDYKMPANIYLSTIPIALFGLNEFSTVFTSAISGTVVTLFVYYLVQELLLMGEKKEESKFTQYRVQLGLLIALFFAISPWSIQFSRIGFEANVGIIVTIPAIILFLRAIRQKSLLFLLLSSILFGLSIYFYRSIVVFIPFLLISFLIIFHRDIVKWKKAFLLFFIIFLMLSVPMYLALVSKGGSVRATQVSIFDNTQQQVYFGAVQQEKAHNSLLSKIIYNRRVVYAEIFAQGYLSHFSWSFLFSGGDPEGRHSTRGMGMLYLWEFPAILFGIWVLIKVLPKKTRWIIVSWILIAPIPAAVAVPTPHALRSLNILPMPEILSGLGIAWIFFKLQGIKRKIFIGFLILVITCFFSYYLFLYYGSSAKETSSDFADGYKELIQYVLPREKEYQKIIISGHYWKPYIYVLFYKKYDPLLYQKYGHWYGFGKYLFGGTSWGQGEHELNNIDLKKYANANHILVALSPSEYLSQKFNIRVIQKIYNHNGDLVFIVGYTP